MINIRNATFSNNRNGKANSSLDLKNGYAQAPEGVYFNSDFTITAWVMLRKNTVWARIIDFGNGIQDNIILCFIGAYINPYFEILYGIPAKGITASSPLVLNQWYFISASLQNETANLYLNGTLVSTGLSQKPKNITRTTNYVGKDNWGYSTADCKIEELKIYNKALNQTEILKEMNL